jgi:capsular exopolysaccharide synthesis family protein
MAVVATPRALQRLDTAARPRVSPLRSVWARVVRRKWFVVAGVLATLLPALVLTLLHDDLYRAESTMLLTRSSIDELVELDANAGDTAARRINNEIGIVEGVIVRSQVLTTLGLEDAPRAQAFGDASSDLITVRVEATTAELAAVLANAYVDAYIQVKTAENAQLANTAVARLQEWIADLQTQIEALDDRLAASTNTTALIAERTKLGEEQAELSDNLQQLRVDVALGIAPAEVVDTATEPGSPFEPDLWNVLIAALAAGLALGLIGAFVVDEFDDTLRSVDDVRRLTGVGPVLAAVPIDPSAATPPIALVRSSDPAATAYRVLRNQLVALDRTRQVFQVTSVGAGSGATTTAANLGIAFAEHGDSVVVVDADLRNPHLHKVFGVSGRLGLVDNLADESIDMTSLPLDERLTVIASGPIPPDPAAVLASNAFDEFVAELRRRFTYVVIDTPPLDTASDTASDAALVARTVDAVIVVTGMGDSSAREVDRTVAEFVQTGAPLAGVVANRIHGRHQGRHQGRSQGRIDGRSRRGRGGRGGHGLVE